MDITIELAQRIKDNQRMHLESTLPVFTSAFIKTPVLQMAAISFAAQTSDQNEQLIDKLTANFIWLLKPLAQAVRKNQQTQRPRFELYCNNSLLPLPASRNNDNQNNRTINNNIPNQRPNYANINFFGKNLLVKTTSENANQPEENLFFAFNLTNNDHNIDELAINTSDLTKKKKKAKVDFVLDPKKASTSTADNNEPPKAKVFKNLSKLEPSKIVQKSGPYSVVKDFMKTPAHIIFGQLMIHPQFKKDLCKSLIPKKKTPKTNKCLCQTGLANNSNVTLLICKAQVAGYFIDLILNSRSSVSVIAKHFLEAIGRKIDKSSIWLMTNIYDDKKKGLGIAKAVSVCINSISIKTDMEVFEAKEYTIIVNNEWLKNAKTLLDYELCELIIKCGEKPIVQNQEEEQSDNDESNKEEDQEEQEKTAEFVYTIFTSNGKPLDKVKANKEEIIKTWQKSLIHNECKFCLIYYKDWEPISLISQEKLKEVQKFFENEPPEIQSLVVKQRESSLEEKKVDIENLLARNSPVISKENDIPG
ncbi:hypothetical protein G9A89_012792 [Geosiphon pyriformis]|nr:hypothetical protein G9A89_012792 [Geosiphon pyriformis]